MVSTENNKSPKPFAIPKRTPTSGLLVWGFLALGLAAAGYAPAAQSAANEKNSRAAGRVLDTDGQPVAGAEVLAYSGTHFERKVKTSADGSYVIGDLPPGKYHLKARKGKLFTKQLPQYDIAVEHGSSLAVELTLVPGGTIELTVIDKVSRKPVAGANVWFDCDEPGKRTTDKKGKASISGFDYDEVGFQVNAEGYAKQGRYSYHQAITEPGKTSAVTIELEPERTITGTIVNHEGEALSDAVVTVNSRWQGRWGTAGADWDPAMTDESGEFCLGGLGEGEYTYRLTATKEGFAPGHASVHSEKMSGVKIVLHPGATLEGSVRDAKGAPVAGVTVMLGEDVSTLSDAEGRWSLARIEQGTHKLVAEKGDLRSKEKEMDIKWTDRIKAIDLVLKKKEQDAFDVSGVVVDDIDGKPIPNVRLRFWNLGDRGEKKTDASGRFRFKDIPIGKRRLYFRGMPDRYVDPLEDIEFPVEHDIEDMVVRLPRGTTIRGRVLLPSGEGAWEAKIRPIHPSFDRSSRGRRLKLTADSEGRFEAKGVLAGVGYRVRAEIDGYPPAISDRFNLRQGESIEDITVQFKQPGRLCGSIKDDQGKPLAKNYWLTAHFPDVEDGAWNNSWMAGRVTPNDAGRFEIPVLSPGKVILQLWREGRGLDGSPGWSGVADRKVVQIVLGQETKDVDFVIGAAEFAEPQKLDGYISGCVVSIESDEGIAGIDVYARCAEFRMGSGWSGKATTGPDGSFRISGLHEGVFEVRANSGHEAGYDEQELIGIPSPSEDIPFVLRRLCAVEGQVIEKGSGKPVTEFAICDVGSREQRIRDPQGRFRLENLQRGACQLRVVAEEGVAQRCIELAEGETIGDVVLVLHEPWSIGGRVIRAGDGTPVAGAVVTAASLEKGEQAASTTGPDGRFLITGVFPGTDTLFVEHPDLGRPWFPDIEIQETLRQDDVVLKVQQPATVKGRVLFEKGYPYEGIEVRIAPGEGGYSRLLWEKAVTGYEGDYVFPAIPPGEYTVVWNMRDPNLGRGGFWGQTIELVSGETVTVDFGTGNAIVSGTVTDRGQPKGWAVVTFTTEGVKRLVQTDHEGKYRVYGLEAGDYHLTLALPSQQDTTLAEREIKIPAQGQVRLDFDISAGASSETETRR